MSDKVKDSAVASLKLTEWTSCGGCAAKWGKDLLAGLVDELPTSADPSLLVGLAPFDDAAVYRVSDDVAIVSTTDFFPPLVDHPADFGAIAAAMCFYFQLKRKVLRTQDFPDFLGVRFAWNTAVSQGNYR
ncbi:MAG: AIR synthase related protein, partial [Actinomycetota bacterium]